MLLFVLGLVEKLLQHGAKVSHKDKVGDTCLHLAMISAKPYLIGLLIDAGLSTHAKCTGKT